MARRLIYQCGIWLSIVVTLTTHLAHGDVQPLHELCPYTTFCTKGPEKSLSWDNQRSCCLPCSCSDKCVLLGNCCPDKPDLPKSPPPIAFSCRSQYNIYNQLLNRSLFYYGTDFRVIDRCPGETSHKSNLNDHARSSCYNQRDLNELMFVSDANTFDVYVNRFCAECNGVKNIDYWHLRIECGGSEILSVSSFQDRDEYIKRKCRIHSVPPTHDIGMHSVCFVETTNTCDWSATSTRYDPLIEELCHKYHISYTVLLKMSEIHYNNIYCYMCNKHATINPPAYCPAIDMDTARFTIKPLTMLYFNTPNTETDIKRARCKEDQVVDPFMVSLTLSLIYIFEKLHPL